MNASYCILVAKPLDFGGLDVNTLPVRPAQGGHAAQYLPTRRPLRRPLGRRAQGRASGSRPRKYRGKTGDARRASADEVAERTIASRKQSVRRFHVEAMWPQ